ncbi:MAG: ubiquinone/menaquinone biosynthesis methyltransferase [Anaerolineales bacterium]|nr:ubiquinone/menaquinone biosynthesis methyltransferase [Anaerolineales bacterium]
MTHLKGNQRAAYVQSMFGRIAHRYDLLNRLMTVGQDIRWRRELIRRLNLSPEALVIDTGAGTGDLALEIKRKHPQSVVVASDFTYEMVLVGKQRPGAHAVHWVIADAINLPFASGCADRVVSGFLLRNVPDVPRTLDEQYRCLRSGGQVGSIDTTPPRDNWLRPFLEFHLHTVIPFLGRLVAGDAEAYTYLPDSTEKFLTAEHLAAAFSAAGFKAVGFARRMFGTIGIHWGHKD